MSRLIAFWSPSGAGATTLTLNAAAALGARRAGVAAVDLNLITPSLALAADLLPHERPGSACISRLLPALESGRLTLDDLSRSLLYGNGFALLPGMLDVVAATRMTEAYIRRIIGLLAVRFDLILADVTPALDSVACLPVLEMADLILLVTGPEIASRFHTRRFVLPAVSMGLTPKLRLVLNRAGSISPGQVAEETGVKPAALVPDLKLMAGLAEAGQIAYLAQTPHPALNRFRIAVDQMTAIITQTRMPDA